LQSGLKPVIGNTKSVIDEIAVFIVKLMDMSYLQC